MTGSRNHHSLLKYGMALIASLAVLSTILAGPVSAHTPNNYQKARDHLRARARNVTGTPYRYGGSSPSGFDCSGFTRWTFDGHGARLPRTSMEQFKLATRAGHKRVWKRSKLQVGDLVFHKTTSARVGHVGIFIGNGKFISSTSSDGVRVRSIWDRYYWGPRWVGATRVPATIRYKG
ncbi:MAG: C40 family peptidase [Actinomycetota bacterium]